MNLATSSPVVFSKYTTPDCDVAAAVAASSAIPLGFDSGRPMMLRPGGGFAVHRVVDGGAWANYHSSSSRTLSFRAYHRLPEMDSEEKMVGFVLDRAQSEEHLVPWKIRGDLHTDELEDEHFSCRL